jgi:hypothetical protein
MLYTEKIAVCSEINTKHINKMCVQKEKFLKVKPAGATRRHKALKGLFILFLCAHVGKQIKKPPAILRITRGQIGRVCEVGYSHRPEQWFIMGGAIPPLPLYTFMVCTVTTLHFMGFQCVN